MFRWILTTKPLPGDAEPASRDESGGRMKLIFSVSLSVLPRDIAPPSETRLLPVEKLVLVSSPSKFSSVIGYIAKSVSLVGKGEKPKAHRGCDDRVGALPFDVNFLLLIKVCIPCTRAHFRLNYGFLSIIYTL